MSEKIDYDAYLKQLGDIDTNQKNRLKAYLEEQCKYDDALKACYFPEKMDDCYEFFKECYFKMAQKDKTDAAVVIEDAVGYKIARDYFIEILPNLKKEPPEKETEKKADEKTAETPPEVSAVTENQKAVSNQKDKTQFDKDVEELIKNYDANIEHLATTNDIEAGAIIDCFGQRLFFKDLKEGMLVSYNDKCVPIYQNCVIKICRIEEDRIYYYQPWEGIVCRSKEKINGVPLDAFKDFIVHKIPADAKRIGYLGHDGNRFFTSDIVVRNNICIPVAVAEDMNKDATSDNVKRDKYGFEIFGEENDEPEEAEKAAPEPCHQDEAGETAEAPEIKALEPNEEDDVFLSGQAFNAGDIIDKHGRRIFFKDLMPGMRFVRADDPDSLQYMVVCVVKNIKEDCFSYDNNEHNICRYFYDSKENFDSETSKCGGFGYAVPGDAMIIGKIENGERKLFEEAAAATADYDAKGNGLLFGF